jgi:hypothetical protein
VDPHRPAAPERRFCSMHHLKFWSSTSRRNDGMVDMTKMEKQAIKDARRPFAEALTELGLMEPFFNRSAEDIDRLITAAVTGFKKSMDRQSPLTDDEVPF